MNRSVEEIERKFLRALGEIRSEKSGMDSQCLAVFLEQEDGYPDVAETFASVVSVATQLWGPPIRRARGPAYTDGNTEGVPRSLWDTRSLEVAWWRTAEFVASLT